MPLRNRWLLAIIFASALLVHADDSNLLPKYGSREKSEALKASDAAFIAAIDEEYKRDRKKAAEYFAERGWEYLKSGNPSDAMRRFNQAWLLDSRNGAALWGMGAVQSDAGKFEDAVNLFAEAEAFVRDNLNFSVDYAVALGMAGVSLDKESLMKDAFKRFEAIHKKAPKHTKNLQNWAVALFTKGRFAEAWEKIILAEATPNKKDLNPAFLRALQAQMPRPKK